VCPLRASAFGEGVALGSCLPDSSIVGRTAPIVSGFRVRERGGRGVLVCPARVSFLIGLAVPETVGVSVAAGSESDPRLPAACGGFRFSRRSAASAPAIRICSAVGVADVDLFSRDLGLVRAGGGDSEEVSSGDAAACLGASGLVSRPTITSCAWISPTRRTLQSSALDNPFSITSPDKQIRHVGKPSLARRCRVYPAGRVTWITGNGKRSCNSFSR
jgi:hypothetical protein